MSPGADPQECGNRFWKVCGRDLQLGHTGVFMGVLGGALFRGPLVISLYVLI